MSSDEHAAATLKAYFRVFGALMVLTALTVAVAYVDLGRWNDFVALSIAITKGVLVVLIFPAVLSIYFDIFSLRSWVAQFDDGDETASAPAQAGAG